VENPSRVDLPVWGQARVRDYGCPVAFTVPAVHSSPRCGPGQESRPEVLARSAAFVRGVPWVTVRAAGLPVERPYAMPACQSVLPYRRMSLPLLLLVGSLLPLPAPGQFSGSGEGADWSAPVRRGYVPGDPAAYGREPGSWGEEPSFEYSTPDDVWGAAAGAASPPGAYPGGAGVVPGRRAAAGNVAPFPPDAASPDGGQQGSWTRPGNQGFRFRGDKGLPDGAWQDSANAPGYRFRPLTPMELDRSSGSDGWRPISGEDRHPGQAREAGPVGPDAYGYQSDTWFRKYYGERP
jgi:hypothetical protein